VPSEHDLRTRFSIEASDLADALNAALGTIRIRPAGYRPELTKPEGQSTGGGVRALQHLRLVPQLEGAHTLVVGHANRADKKAELRSFEHIDALHRKQWAVPAPLDRKDYEDFLEMAANLLEVLRLETTVSGQPRISLRPSSQPPPRRAGIIGFVLGVLAAAAIAVGLFFLLRGR
jgi:hypothetical protein